MTEPVVLINSFQARWRSVEEFTAATRSPGMRQAAAGLAGYRLHPARYRAVRT